MTDRAFKPLPNQLLLPFPEEESDSQGERPCNSITQHGFGIFPGEDEELDSQGERLRSTHCDWQTASAKGTKVNDARCDHRMPGVLSHIKDIKE